MLKANKREMLIPH